MAISMTSSMIFVKPLLNPMRVHQDPLTLGFVQLGTGWVLRELSRADLEGVIEFIKEHYEKFSREGLRYAIEKMDSKTRTILLKYEKPIVKDVKRKKSE
jgi:hypothetical protein